MKEYNILEATSKLFLKKLQFSEKNVINFFFKAV